MKRYVLVRPRVRLTFYSERAILHQQETVCAKFLLTIHFLDII